MVGKTGRAEGTALQRPWGEEHTPFHASGLTVGLPQLPKPSEPSRSPGRAGRAPLLTLCQTGPPGPRGGSRMSPLQAGEATGPSLLRTALPGSLGHGLALANKREQK